MVSSRRTASCALLSEGGQIYKPIEETFFSHRFGQLRDRFGTSWMILCQKATGVNVVTHPS
jgi:PhnB protein